MSSNRTTQGRLPASVYRRRRAMVLLGLVAVIIAIVLVIVRPGASQGDEVAQTTPASASATPAASPAATPPASAEPAATTAPVDGAACVDAQIIVEAVTDAAVYAAGEQPNLSVTITNSGSNACVIDVGTAAQVFTVKSGNEVYWTSTDCQVDPVAAEVTLAPGQVVSSSEPLVWDRTRSSADTCEGERAAVPGGGASYHLGVSVDGFESEATRQFLLY